LNYTGNQLTKPWISHPRANFHFAPGWDDTRTNFRLARGSGIPRLASTLRSRMWHLSISFHASLEGSPLTRGTLPAPSDRALRVDPFDTRLTSDWAIRANILYINYFFFLLCSNACAGMVTHSASRCLNQGMYNS
jgi:hypothetical protein